VTATVQIPTPSPVGPTPTGAFWRYWTASTVSSVGDAVTTVALPLTAVTVLHASSFQVSLLTAATFAAWVLIGLPAGVVVSRLPMRGTQVAMDLVRAAALLSVPLAAWAGVLSIAQLLGVALVVSLATVVFDVGNSTFLVSVVGKDELTRRNSLTSGTYAVTQTAGPSIGGVLVSVVGAAGAIVADVVSYAVSAAVLSRLPRAAVGEVDRDVSMRTAIRDGWRYVVDHPVIRPCVAMAVAVNFVCGGLMALTPLFLVRTLHAPIGLVGVLMAAEGVGTLAGATLTTRVASRLGSARTVRVASLVGSLFALAMPLAFGGVGLVVFGVGNAGFAAGVVILSVLTRTHRQQTTPPELLARVMATVRFISWGVIPLGAVLAGGLATAFGIRTALGVVVALTLLVPAIGEVSGLRSRRDLADG
jgi:MFS family permease